MQQLIQLPPKISGFHNKSEAPPQPMSIAGFLDASIQFAQHTQYTLVQFCDFSNLPNRSYHLAYVRSPQNVFYLILCNKYHPFLAVSEVLHPQLGLDFSKELPQNRYTDLPEVEDFYQLDFTVLPKDLLERKVDADNPESSAIVKELQAAEFAEFAYYEPRIIADIVFNDWTKGR